MKNLLILLVASVWALTLTARAAGTNAAPSLTFELRDGSRVIGTTAAVDFKFHSPLLGDLKLPVGDIRMVDCPDAKPAKLTTVRGDMLTVSFADPDFKITTSFGKVELATDSIRRLTVANPSAGLTGLVARWSAEDYGKNSLGDDQATMHDVRAGTDFIFNGIDSYLQIPACAAADASADGSFTITAWIYPARIGGETPIFEYERQLGTSVGSDVGVQLFFSVGPASGTGNGCLMANVVDTGGGSHILTTPPGLIQARQWQLVALSYDRVAGHATIYLNGRAVVDSDVGTFKAQTGFDLIVGARTTFGSEAYPAKAYAGAMKQISIYHRALSADEIQSLRTGEKPVNSPELPITTQPQPFPGMPGGRPIPVNGAVFQDGSRAQSL